MSKLTADAESGASSMSELDTLRSDLAAARAQATSQMAELAAHAETKTQLEGVTAELDALKKELSAAKTDAANAADKAEKAEKAAASEKERADKAEAAAKEGGKKKKGKADDAELKQLREQVKKLEADVEEEKSKSAETEKEHEDLLVLLDELSSKRKRDKAAMRDKGLDVSEDEDDEEDEEEEDDDE